MASTEGRKYNEQDKRRRLNMGWYGETNPMAKLDRQSVVTIKNLCASGLYSQKDIGDMFKINQSTVSNIYREKTWNQKQLTPVEDKSDKISGAIPKNF